MNQISNVGDCVSFSVMHFHNLRTTHAVVTEVTVVYKVRLADGSFHTIDSKETVPGSIDLYKQEKALRTASIKANKELEDFLSKHLVPNQESLQHDPNPDLQDDY